MQRLTEVKQLRGPLKMLLVRIQWEWGVTREYELMFIQFIYEVPTVFSSAVKTQM